MSRLFKFSLMLFFAVALSSPVSSFAGWDVLVRALRGKCSVDELSAIRQLLNSFDESLYYTHFDRLGGVRKGITLDATRRLFASGDEFREFIPVRKLRPLLDRSGDNLDEILDAMVSNSVVSAERANRVKLWARQLTVQYGDELGNVFRRLWVDEAYLKFSKGPANITNPPKIVLDPSKLERFYTAEELQYFKKALQERWVELEGEIIRHVGDKDIPVRLWAYIDEHRELSSFDIARLLKSKSTGFLKKINFHDIAAVREEQHKIFRAIHHIEEGTPVGKVQYSREARAAMNDPVLRRRLKRTAPGQESSGMMTMDEAFYFGLSRKQQFLFNDALQTWTDFRRGLTWTFKTTWTKTLGVGGTITTFVVALTAAQPLAQLYVGGRVKRLAMTVAQGHYQAAILNLETENRPHMLDTCPYCNPAAGDLSNDHKLTVDWGDLTDLYFAMYTAFASEATDEMGYGRHNLTGLIKDLVTYRTAIVSNRILEHVIKMRLGIPIGNGERHIALGDINEIIASNQWLIELALVYPLWYPNCAKVLQAPLYHLGFQHFLHRHQDLARTQYLEIEKFLSEANREEQGILKEARRRGLEIEEKTGRDIYSELGIDPTKELNIDVDLDAIKIHRIIIPRIKWDYVKELVADNKNVDLLERIQALDKRYDDFIQKLMDRAVRKLQQDTDNLTRENAADFPNIQDEINDSMGTGAGSANWDDIKKIAQLLEYKIDSLIETNREFRVEYDKALLKMLEALAANNEVEAETVTKSIGLLLNELKNAVLDRNIIQEKLDSILGLLEDRLPASAIEAIAEAKLTLHEEHAEIKDMLEDIQDRLKRIEAGIKENK